MTIAASWTPDWYPSLSGRGYSLWKSRVIRTVGVRLERDLWGGASQPPWVNDVVDRLVDVYELQYGWDGVGGVPISEMAFETSLHILPEIMSEQTIAPLVVPTASGGIQLEWHCAGVDLEIYIEEDGQVSVWCREGSREWEDDYYPRTRLTKELSLLTSEFC